MWISLWCELVTGNPPEGSSGCAVDEMTIAGWDRVVNEYFSDEGERRGKGLQTKGKATDFFLALTLVN
jgi:hypothetical protein